MLGRGHKYIAVLAATIGSLVVPPAASADLAGTVGQVQAGVGQVASRAVAEVTEPPAAAPAQDTVAPVRHAVEQTVAPVRQTVQDTVAPVQQTAETAVAPVRQTVRSAVEPVRQTVRAVSEPARQTVGSVAEPVRQTVGSVAEPVRQTVGSVVEPVRRKVQSVSEPVRGVADVARATTGEVAAQLDRVLTGMPISLPTGEPTGPAGADAGLSEALRPAFGQASATGRAGQRESLVEGAPHEVFGTLPFSLDRPLTVVDESSVGVAHHEAAQPPLTPDPGIPDAPPAGDGVTAVAPGSFFSMALAILAGVLLVGLAHGCARLRTHGLARRAGPFLVALERPG